LRSWPTGTSRDPRAATAPTCPSSTRFSPTTAIYQSIERISRPFRRNVTTSIFISRTRDREIRWCCRRAWVCDRSERRRCGGRGHCRALPVRLGALSVISTHHTSLKRLRARTRQESSTPCRLRRSHLCSNLRTKDRASHGASAASTSAGSRIESRIIASGALATGLADAGCWALLDRLALRPCANWESERRSHETREQSWSARNRGRIQGRKKGSPRFARWSEARNFVPRLRVPSRARPMNAVQDPRRREKVIERGGAPASPKCGGNFASQFDATVVRHATGGRSRRSQRAAGLVNNSLRGDTVKLRSMGAPAMSFKRKSETIILTSRWLDEDAHSSERHRRGAGKPPKETRSSVIARRSGALERGITVKLQNEFTT